MISPTLLGYDRDIYIPMTYDENDAIEMDYVGDEDVDDSAYPEEQDDNADDHAFVNL